VTAPIPGRWLAAIGAIVTLIALPAIGARATYGARTTADEPQYLLSASSLVADGDLDIGNQLEARSYLPYHEITVDTQTRALDESGRRVSPHDPLLPVLLAAPMAIGGWVGAKGALAVVAGLTAALTAWTANRRFAVDRVAALVAVTGCFAGIPLAAYGTQVYPEVPAALLVVVAVTALTGDGDQRPLSTTVIALAAIIGLPWLAVKYVPVAAVLGLALLGRSRRHPKLIVGILGVAAAAGVIYLRAHQVIYGGWTVYASGDHFESTGEFSVVGTEVNVLGRNRRLIGLLVDRRFGIGVWSPIWFLLAPAVVGALRARRRSSRPDRAPLWLGAAVVGVGWLTATFVALTMHGWWVPGRQLVVVLPIAALFIARWASLSRRRLLVTGSVALIGTANWLWLAVESSTGRRTLVVDFAETSAPFYRLLSPVFPDGIVGGPTHDLGLVLWAVLLAGAVWRSDRSGQELPDPSTDRPQGSEQAPRERVGIFPGRQVVRDSN